MTGYICTSEDQNDSSDYTNDSLKVSLTHPHDPYAIDSKYWDRYEEVDIELPKVRIHNEKQDSHSKRLLRVCDLWDQEFTDDQIKTARRAYYGAVSYVDDCVGKLLDVLNHCRLENDTIIIFSGDHGDMLGERNLWSVSFTLFFFFFFHLNSLEYNND